MGFLKKLFGGGEPKKYVDKQGIYFYIVCDNCGSQVKVRADKQHDLQNTGSGYEWHKTIVDNRCFRRIRTVVQLDDNFQMTNHEITGGRFISEETFVHAEAELAAEKEKQSASEQESESD
ncbi:MAG: hypothetical protein DHS20C20_24710 [Ardenticatenaceae bacterium]|nr:MAG: hypothetical protein DHS20C20_24710 [Ardenticatenaceae bacterium]